MGDLSWPQWAMIGIWALSAAFDIARINGWKPNEPGAAKLGFRILFRPIFYGSILYFGGFFS